MRLLAGVLLVSMSIQAAQLAREVTVERRPGVRRALLIGNDRYPNAPLRQAVNDAQDLSTVLRTTGFQTTVAVNLRLVELDRAISEFLASIGPGDVALFFYAGHGVQLAGDNYMVPVDFAPADEVDARYAAYSMSRLQERIEATGSQLSLLIFDACRDNPFRGTRGTSGLLQMSVGRGTFIAFSTAPGRVAYETASTRNSIFTRHLIRALGTPGLTLDQVFNQVREAVFAESAQRQLPWSSSSVIGEFRFRALPSPEPTRAAIEPPKPAATDEGQPLRVGQDGVEAPTVKSKREPKMPPGSRGGTVELSLVVDTSGKATRLSVLKATDTEHANAAIEAVRDWRFEPGRKQGIPVPVEATVMVNFALAARTAIDLFKPSGTAQIGEAGITKPVLTKRFPPEFVSQARKLKRVYWLFVYVEIDESGRVVVARTPDVSNEYDAQVNEALKVLVAESMKAVQKWEFQPATRDGRPIRVAGVVQFNFRQRIGIAVPRIADMGADWVEDVRP